ncbi:uncharacterized protein LOC111365549 [Olea europaea var. sylvestris]|uniref:uncharacterized protein LOC111365549 n=1 Tax=Olea europaea var. sylvestris TaxID=158386 RepID=UPI000C1D565D|nr:uncharacterized protein LOC111365549 [Olea europaea var. sylvestris]
MESTIASLCAKLSLIAQEEDVLLVEEDEVLIPHRSDKCLLFKLLSSKHFNKEAFKGTMRRLWHPNRTLSIHDLFPNLHIAEFDDNRDKDRVKCEGPWVFGKQLVLTKDVDGLEQIHQILFSEANFWVRIHDLHVMVRNWKMGDFIGRQLGKVIEVDIDKIEIARGEFLHVRVCLDISKPLLRGKKIYVGSYKPFWTRFSYERLPNFCYLCGVLGHGHKDYILWKPAMEAYTTSDYSYGPWLRAGNSSDYSGPIVDRQINSRTPDSPNSLANPSSDPSSANITHVNLVNLTNKDQLLEPYGKGDPAMLLNLTNSQELQQTNFEGISTASRTATNLELTPLQTDAIMDNLTAENTRHSGLADTQTKGTHGLLQTDPVSSNSAEVLTGAKGANFTRRWKRLNTNHAIHSIVPPPQTSLKRSLDFPSENAPPIPLKLLSWNAQGHRNPRGIHALSNLIRKEDPDVLFLQETKLNAANMELCRIKLKFYGCLNVQAVGRSGGIALLWKSNVNLSILGYSTKHIDAKIESPLHCWFLTGIYGHPETTKRMETWNLLKRLKRNSSEAWLVFGDFNEILSNEEKWGGRDRPRQQLENFQHMFLECELRDLGFKGPYYTWYNGRHDTNQIFERLDRFIANDSWCRLFTQAMVTHGSTTYSDHRPLWIQLQGASQTLKGPKPFRFESMWIGEKACSDIVLNQWSDTKSQNLESIMRNISCCSSQLQLWNRSKFGRVQAELNKARTKLSQIQKKDPATINTEALRTSAEKVQTWMDREELMWKQQPRAAWLEQGDQNTRYFHAKASQRRKTNSITKLLDDQGCWQDGGACNRLITNYFSDLFSSTGSRNHAAVLDNLECKLTYDMNIDLIQTFTEIEVSQALKEMHPTKAPGPDSMPPLFFQQFWPLIGSSVTNALWQTGKKTVLPTVILETKSAFIKGRLITDNVLAAYEVLHFLRRKKKGRKGYMSLKLDMSKACDRVEWSFLEAVMHKLGFHDKIIQLVMKCVTTTSFSILINGSPTGHITPSRGLRQGDPISPYLFLICTEGLVNLLNKAERNKNVTGIQVCRGAPSLNHLLFADDSLIFCEANESTTSRLQALLSSYEDASGQQLNRDKTSMVFSANVSQDKQESIMALSNAPQVQQYDKYLGLPPMVGRSKTRAFSDIKHKVWLKLQGWKSSMFSQGGREILLKSVALAIPSYAMSCFKLPSTLCTELEKTMARFWWGQRKEERKIHWQSWNVMCKSKSFGGMGFKELQIFNMAMLGKQAWRLLHHTDRLVYRIFSARYFPHGNILKASIGCNPSYAWRGIWEAKNLLVLGGRWVVGNGNTIHILNDKWIPGIGYLRRELGTVLQQNHSQQLEGPVSSLIDHNLSAYRFFKNCLAPDPGTSSRAAENKKFWDTMWRLKIPQKVKIFAWRACQDSLPSKQNLVRRRVSIAPHCCFCNYPVEDLCHVLLHCPSIYQLLTDRFPVLKTKAYLGGFMQAAIDILTKVSKDALSEFLLITWGFWFRRNKMVHDQLHLSPQQIIATALAKKPPAESGLTINVTPGVPLQKYRWSAPPTNALKLNTDGALFFDSNKAGLGIILHDHDGEIILAASRPENSLLEPEHIEAAALVRGLQLCLNLGISHLLVESDCLFLVNEVNKSVLTSASIRS